MLALVLKWLSGGILDSVLKHLEHQGDAKAEVTKAVIQAELDRRKVQADVTKAELGHAVAWVPRFLASMGAAVYLLAHIIDAIWQLPGDVAPLDAASAAVVSVIFAGMFISGK